jgi:hypothetical protein
MSNIYAPSHLTQFAVNQTVYAAALAAQAAQTLDATLQVLDGHLSEELRQQVQNAMVMLAGARYTIELLLDKPQ